MLIPRLPTRKRYVTGNSRLLILARRTLRIREHPYCSRRIPERKKGYIAVVEFIQLTLAPSTQRFVLAEAIKTSVVPVERILPIFYDGSVQPDWHQMLLPHGEFTAMTCSLFRRHGSPDLQKRNQPTDVAPDPIFDY